MAVIQAFETSAFSYPPWQCRRPLSEANSSTETSSRRQRPVFRYSVRDCPQRMYTAVSRRVAVKGSSSRPLGFAGFHNASVSMCHESQRRLMHIGTHDLIIPDGRGIEGPQRQGAESRGLKPEHRCCFLLHYSIRNGNRLYICSAPFGRWVHAGDYASTIAANPCG